MACTIRTNSCQITIKIMMICMYFQPKKKNPSVSIQSLYLAFRYLHHLLDTYINLKQAAGTREGRALTFFHRAPSSLLPLCHLILTTILRRQVLLPLLSTYWQGCLELSSQSECSGIRRFFTSRANPFPADILPISHKGQIQFHVIPDFLVELTKESTQHGQNLSVTHSLPNWLKNGQPTIKLGIHSFIRHMVSENPLCVELLGGQGIYGRMSWNRMSSLPSSFPGPVCTMKGCSFLFICPDGALLLPGTKEQTVTSKGGKIMFPL